LRKSWRLSCQAASARRHVFPARASAAFADVKEAVKMSAAAALARSSADSAVRVTVHYAATRRRARFERRSREHVLIFAAAASVLNPASPSRRPSAAICAPLRKAGQFEEEGRREKCKNMRQMECLSSCAEQAGRWCLQQKRCPCRVPFYVARFHRHAAVSARHAPFSPARKPLAYSSARSGSCFALPRRARRRAA